MVRAAGGRGRQEGRVVFVIRSIWNLDIKMNGDIQMYRGISIKTDDTKYLT